MLTYTLILGTFTEKLDGKTDESLESPDTDMLVQAKTATNVTLLMMFYMLGFKWCTRGTKCLPPSTSYM